MSRPEGRDPHLRNSMNKEAVVQKRLQEFMENLSIEVGEPTLGVLAIVHWSVDMTIGCVMNVPPRNRGSVFLNMTRSFVGALKSFKSKSAVRRESDEDEILFRKNGVS